MSKCPECGFEGAYEGLSAIECPNSDCRHFSALLGAAACGCDADDCPECEDRVPFSCDRSHHADHLRGLNAWLPKSAPCSNQDLELYRNGSRLTGATKVERAQALYAAGLIDIDTLAGLLS